MGFGVSHINHAIHGKLSYENIGSLLDARKKDVVYISSGRSKNYYLHTTHHHNPSTGKYEEARCYRMYATDILQFFANGACHIVTHPSAITYSEINHFGPLRCFNDSTHKMHEKRRFGSWQGDNWPIPDGEITVRKNGTIVEPLVDTYKRVNPKLRAERIKVSKQFRHNALPRMLLNEFGDVWARQRTTIAKMGWGRWAEPGDWQAMVPDYTHCRRFAELMLNNEDHPNLHKIGEHLIAGPSASGSHDAVIKAAEYILQRGLLNDDKYSERVEVKYSKVRVEI